MLRINDVPTTIPALSRKSFIENLILRQNFACGLHKMYGANINSNDIKQTGSPTIQKAPIISIIKSDICISIIIVKVHSCVIKNSKGAHLKLHIIISTTEQLVLSSYFL